MRQLAAIIVLALSVTACAERGTELSGPIACGADTCGAGAVCVTEPSGVDAGVPATATCRDLPDGCVLVDCARDACAACLRALCPSQMIAAIAGRDVLCLAP